MLSDEEMYRRMVKGWRGGLGDRTVCGRSSTRFNTRNIVKWLPEICERYGIESVVDAGAGDLHWIGLVEWDVDYTAFDLIPRHPSVKKLDITAEPPPSCDAVLCRMVLNHLVGNRGDATRVEMALDNFQVAADYLIATHFENGINRKREFNRLDLTQFLGEPLETCDDGHEKGCQLALWRL